MAEILSLVALVLVVVSLYRLHMDDRTGYCIWMIAALSCRVMAISSQLLHEHEAAAELSARVAALEQACECSDD